MTIDWTMLDSGFIVKCQNLFNICEANKLTMVPYYGIRSLEDQAKLWRRSRTTVEVDAEISKLRSENCNYLADIIEKVGVQSNGKWATNSIPGLSWHNWGQALDCYRSIDGKAVWDKDDYTDFGKYAVEVGLKWGNTFKDYNHIQLNQKEVPAIYSLKFVNDYFKDKGQS